MVRDVKAQAQRKAIPSTIANSAACRDHWSPCRQPSRVRVSISRARRRRVRAMIRASNAPIAVATST